MVTCRLRQRSWETPKGERRSVAEIEADEDLENAQVAVRAEQPAPTAKGSWPAAFRAVQAWLIPYSALRRWSWSPASPPRQLQRLLDAVAGGRPLHLHIPPSPTTTAVKTPPGSH